MEYRIDLSPKLTDIVIGNSLKQIMVIWIYYLLHLETLKLKWCNCYLYHLQLFDFWFKIYVILYINTAPVSVFLLLEPDGVNNDYLARDYPQFIYSKLYLANFIDQRNWWKFLKIITWVRIELPISEMRFCSTTEQHYLESKT